MNANIDEAHYPDGDEPRFTQVPAWKVGYKDNVGNIGQTIITEASMDPVVIAFLHRNQEPELPPIVRVYVTYEDGCHVLFEKT